MLILILNNNSNLLDIYEFKAFLKCLKIECSGSFLLFILSAKNFWDHDGMISFDKLAELVEVPNNATSTVSNNNDEIATSTVSNNNYETNIPIKSNDDNVAVEHVIVNNDV